MTRIIKVDQEGVDAFGPQINRLLDILGHPEALVTDLSQFLDFISIFEFPTREKTQNELDRLMRDADVPVKIQIDWTLVKACQEILKANPNWPNQPLVN